MSTTKYIRPMCFDETLGSMFRLYWKILFPILILNIIIVAMAWWVLPLGAFVGPILIMTSNAILGKPLKIWDSFLKGVFSASFLKIALVSIGYFVLIYIVNIQISTLDYERSFGDVNYNVLDYGKLSYLYTTLSPLWIFIPMIMLLEKKGLRASIKRSFQILRKNFFRIIQMDIFINICIAIVAYLFEKLYWSNAGNPSAWYVFYSYYYGDPAYMALLLLFLTGFASLPYVFVYYEYRARYEDYSEELLAQEMGYQPMEEMMNV